MLSHGESLHHPPLRPVPILKLALERLLTPDEEETEVPTLELGFRYGPLSIRASDPRSCFHVDDGHGPRMIDRNNEHEEQARRLLESFGAVEICCLEGWEPAYGSEADYVLAVEGDVHTYCSFGAYALPQLRKLGWQVEIAEGYPFAAMSGDGPWYAALEQQEDEPDWFSFELGVVVDGKRVSLLPALVELLDRQSDGSSLGALLRRPVKFAALPTPDGRFVAVPMERLKLLLTVLRDLHDGTTASNGVRRRAPGENEAWCVPSIRLGALGGLEQAFGQVEQKEEPELEWQGSEMLLARSRSFTAPPRPAEPPKGLLATLRDYQLEGVAWLQRMRELGVGGVLADDMGLGKTLQTIAHLVIEKTAGRLVQPALVVAPTSLVQNWRREIVKFAPCLRAVVYHGPDRKRHIHELDGADVVITSYPLVVRDDETFTGRMFHQLILDEAQTVKNRGSQAHRAVRAIDCTHRLALTGTPIENNLAEIHALYDLLAPGLLGSAENFREHFRRPIEGGNDERLAELRRRVEPFMLRRLKETVAKELPPKTEIVRPVDLVGEQRELYESIRVAAHADVRRIIRHKGLAASTLPVLDALLKLRQACCDPRLLPMEAARRAKRSAKLEVLLDMVSRQTVEGRRVLVFSQFTSMLALISDALADTGIAHNMLTGATLDRQRAVDTFQRGDAPVFLISLKAGGTGLTLTAADTVIHYDPWWNPAAQAQATDRAYRIGQKRPVFVYNLIAAGSVEERILRLQQHKRRLADAIMGAAGARTQQLSTEDIDDLFAPLSR
jgi:superfamily II DNA or RNA helicase